jgi:hypothetical protein
VLYDPLTAISLKVAPILGTGIFLAVQQILGTVLNYTTFEGEHLSFVGLLLPVLAYALVVVADRVPVPAAASSASTALAPDQRLSPADFPSRLVRWLVVLSVGVFYVRVLAAVLALAALAVVLGVGLVSTARRRQWAWLAAMVGYDALLVPAFVFGATLGPVSPVYRPSALVGAGVGILVCLFGIAMAGRAVVQARRRDLLCTLAILFAGLLALLVALLVALLLGSIHIVAYQDVTGTAFPTHEQLYFPPLDTAVAYLSNPIATMVLLALPVLLWALRVGPKRDGARDVDGPSTALQYLVVWLVALLAALLALSQSSELVIYWGAALASGAAFGLTIASTVRRRQRRWLATLLVSTALALGTLIVLALEVGGNPSDLSLALFAGLAAGPLTYALFATPPRSVDEAAQWR